MLVMSNFAFAASTVRFADAIGVVVEAQGARHLVERFAFGSCLVNAERSGGVDVIDFELEQCRAAGPPVGT
jgi:hypothetical protein